MTALRLGYLATDNLPSNMLHINKHLLVSTLVLRQRKEELEVFKLPLCSILLSLFIQNWEEKVNYTKLL